jgi:ABC-type molybdate transport system substrate-binding protein
VKAAPLRRLGGTVATGLALGVALPAVPAQARNAEPAAAPAALSVYAAGSLRAALDEVARAFQQAQGQPVVMTYGASGLLKDRITAGEAPQVFASANTEHPQALVAAGRGAAVTPFTRNALCVLATPAFSLNGKTLAQRLLDAEVRVGTSTPKADPSGDYAFTMFERFEATGATGAGSAEALKRKALQLTGGPQSPKPPAGRNVYGDLVASGQADVFVTYCTNASAARREHPQLQVLPVPAALNVSAVYGLAVLNPATPQAQAYVKFLLGPEGQAVLASHGFSAP